eukprot:GILK01004683.1.p1 GENE.GILK01004683.1~~GILK01004683.1.p1  ORF type:complete len:1005 (-),score=268.75 GILK01004683.1:139-3102(-)
MEDMDAPKDGGNRASVDGASPRRGSLLFSEVSVVNPRGGNQEDSLIFEHNHRFQQLLLESVERQIQSMMDVVDTKNQQLHSAESARENLGVALFSVQRELTKLRDALGSRNDEISRLKHELRVAENAQQKNLADWKRSETENGQLRAQLEKALGESTNTNQSIAKLKETTAIFSSDLKVHQNLERNMRKEIERLEELLEASRRQEAGLRDEIVKINEEKVKVETRCHRQENETKVAQRELEKLSQEFELVSASKSLLLRQWQDALDAMNKRDQSMQQLADTQKHTHERLVNREISERNLKVDYAKLEEDFSKLQRELPDSKNTIARLRKEMEDLQKENMQLEDELALSRSESLSLRRDVQAMEKNRQIVEDRMFHAGEAIVAHRSKMMEYQKKYKEAVSELSDREHKLQSDIKRVDAEGKAMVDATERQHVVTDNKRVKAESRVYFLEIAVESMTQDHQALLDAHENLQQENKRLLNMIHDLQVQLVRREHDVNAAMTRLETRDTDDGSAVKVLNTTVSHLTATLEKKEEELKQLEASWFRTNQQYITEQREKEQLKQQIESMQTNGYKQDIAHNRTVQELNSLTKDSRQGLVREQLLQVEVKELYSKIMKLREESQRLEVKRDEASDSLRMKEEQHVTDIALMRAEITKLKQDKQQLTYDRELILQRSSAVDGRIQLNKEKYIAKQKEADEARVQLRDLQIEHHNLQRVYEANQRELVALTKQMEIMVGKGKYSSDPLQLKEVVRQMKSSVNQSENTKPRERKNSTYPSNGFATGPEDTDGKVVDLTSQLHRAKTVAAERLNESLQLRNQIEQLETTVQQLKRARNDSTHESEETKSRLELCKKELIVLTRRCLRAESIAANLERQLKQSLSAASASIDYSYRPDLEPSTALMAALTKEEDDNSSDEGLSDSDDDLDASLDEPHKLDFISSSLHAKYSTATKRPDKNEPIVSPRKKNIKPRVGSHSGQSSRLLPAIPSGTPRNMSQ